MLEYSHHMSYCIGLTNGGCQRFFLGFPAVEGWRLVAADLFLPRYTNYEEYNYNVSNVAGHITHPYPQQN